MIELPSPSLLWHGTSARHLDSILSSGLEPRSFRDDGDDKGNWVKCPSHPDRVYLTTSFAVYYAHQAIVEDQHSAERCMIVEVDVPGIEHGLVPDEDALEQATRSRDSLPAKWGMVQRTAHYRRWAHRYDWRDSVAALGTCAHQGYIDPSHIRRVIVFDLASLAAPLMGAWDVTVSVLANQINGRAKQALLHWLIDGVVPDDLKPAYRGPAPPGTDPRLRHFFEWEFYVPSDELLALRDKHVRIINVNNP